MSRDRLLLMTARTQATGSLAASPAGPGPSAASCCPASSTGQSGLSPPPFKLLPRPLPQGYVTADVAEKEGLHKLNLSGTKFRKMLRAGGWDNGWAWQGLAVGAASSTACHLAPASGLRLAVDCLQFSHNRCMHLATQFYAPLLVPCAGEDIPEWFAFKSVVSVLREAIAEESSASDTDSS